jgi:Xaa-Pro aminopeptidase
VNQALLLVGDSASNANLFYKTGFLAGDAFVYAERDGQAMLVVNAMEKGRAEKESSVEDVRSFDEFGYRELVMETNDRNKAFAVVLGKVLEVLTADSVVVEGKLPVLYADGVRAEGVVLTIDPDLLVDSRRRKSPPEIAAIKEAQSATQKAMAHAIGLISSSEEKAGLLHFGGIPLTSERMQGEIEALLLREGMDTSEGPIVAGGPGASDPHWLGSGALRAGEAIVIDIFPRSKRTRYYADMTRTVVKGPASETLTAMFEATARALDAALAVIGPGVDGSQVHAAVREVFAQSGFEGEGPGARFIHGTGHGIGLEIHESPSIGTRHVELRPGDVVTVEPGLYDPKVGGVRLEDLIVVTDDGFQNLTDFPRQLEV